MTQHFDRIVSCFLFLFFVNGCSPSNEHQSNREISDHVENVRPTVDIDPELVKLYRPNLDRSLDAVRFATFNISFHRNAEGELSAELEQKNSQQAKQIAEIVQQVRPDVILLNEFDYDTNQFGLQSFQNDYLRVPQGEQEAIEYPYSFTAPVNTGKDSGHDLNADGVLAGVDDAFGYGTYPGQYGMVVLSQYPIEVEKVRTFQNFLWKDMPNPMWPIDPIKVQSYYSEEVKQILRLSSKSHWDVPIRIGNQTIHFLASHPTPPVFDGPEDRNGCRNHDEIRFWADYISGLNYAYDDSGIQSGLPRGASFIIAGDLNADPVDGDSRNQAVLQLIDHPLINRSVQPHSAGGVYHACMAGEGNLQHQGNPAFDTADFGSVVGNLRVDYCLPSRDLKPIQAGVFWPMPDENGSNLVAASDHRLVWIDVKREP